MEMDASSDMAEIRGIVTRHLGIRVCGRQPSGIVGAVEWNLIAAILAGVVAVWAAMVAVFWIVRPKGVSIGSLVRLVPDVLRLLRSLITDAAAPLDVRIVLVGLVAWIVSPIDLIPEFIPVIGPIDDVVVAIAALRYVRRRIGIEELRRRWIGTPEGFELLTRIIGGG
jgi:uncharacterized membrane protein YkvA (DUF1232 family)